MVHQLRAIPPAAVCSLLEAVPVACCMLDARGIATATNAAWRALFGALPGLQPFAEERFNLFAICREAKEPADLRGLATSVRRVLSRKGAAAHGGTRESSCDFRVGERWFMARISALSCEATGCTVLCEDVTERRGTEQELQSLKAVEHIYQRNAEQYALLAQFGQFALENPSLPELTARVVQVVEQGLGTDFSRLLMMSPDEQQLVHVAGHGWDQSMLGDGRFDIVAETEDRFVHGARESVIVEDYRLERRFKASPVQRRHGVRSASEVLICGGNGIYGVLGAYMRKPGQFDEHSVAFLQNLANTISAFMERKAVEDRLSSMAQFDALTGLPNRTTYLDRLAHALQEATRDRRPVAVLFVDIDRFKAVNDTLGHAVGDALLVAIARRLREAVRTVDTIGRLSGDEFALVLAHLGREEDAGLVAGKIVAALSTPFNIEGHTVYVSGSVGISLAPSDALDPEVLLKNADLAMYRAKQSGRNGYQFYLPQMQERAVSRLRLESRLRTALERDEFVLHFQPKVDLRSGGISGLEALLRWQSHEGLVAPNDFIPVLEDTGLIIPVGERVMAKVCAQLGAWRDAGLAPPPVAVNISVRQFRQDRFDVALLRLVREGGVDPRLIELELTESLLMSDAQSAVEALRRLKDQGVLLALDDFGTGYSSLTYLKKLPLDALKIDRAFIRDVMEDPSDASIVTTIVNLAHNLDLKVIAEGVETPQQMSFLRQRACDEAQGHYLSPPLPAAEMTRVLQERQQWSASGRWKALPDAGDLTP